MFCLFDYCSWTKKCFINSLTTSFDDQLTSFISIVYNYLIVFTIMYITNYLTLTS